MMAGLRWLTALAFLLMAFQATSSQRPAFGQAFTTGPDLVRPTSMRSPLDRRLETQPQIRVRVTYLLLDAETRRKLYAAMPPESINTSTSLPGRIETETLQTQSHDAACQQQIRVPTRATTCLIDAETEQTIRAEIESLTSSSISKSPAVILLGGSEAEVNDLTQLPFVVDARSARDETNKTPSLCVLDQGTRIRILADAVRSSESSTTEISLVAEVRSSTVAGVTSDEIFGRGDEPLVVQVPEYHVKSAMVSEVLASGQSLWIDLHQKQSGQIQQETAVPILGRVPYVGKSFTNTSDVSIDQYRVVMLRPEFMAP